MKFSYNFYSFICSHSLILIATGCIRFAVSWQILKETDSIVLFSSVYSITAFIEIYFKPILAPISDLFERTQIYAWCVFLSLLSTFMLLLFFTFFNFSLLTLTVLLILQSLSSSLRDPTSSAMVPSLVETKHLSEAVSIRATISSALSLATPILGAVLLALGNIKFSLVIACLLCLISYILVLNFNKSLKPSTASPPNLENWWLGLKTWNTQIRNGMKAVLLNTSERSLALCATGMNLGLYPFFYMTLPIWVKQELKATPTIMAIIDTAFGVGILIGSLCLNKFLLRYISSYKVMIIGSLFLGLNFILTANTKNTIFIVFSFFIAGIGFISFNIIASTLRSTATPQSYRTRMFAGAAFLSSFLNPFATQTMGFIVAHFGVHFSMILSGGLIITATLFILRNKDLKFLLNRKTTEIEGAYSSLYPQAFKGIEQKPEPLANTSHQ